MIINRKFYRQKRFIILLVAILVTPLIAWGASQIKQSFDVSAASPFQITYNPNGGLAGTSGALACDQDTDNSCTFTIPSGGNSPTRSGYDLLGWADSATATTAKYSEGGTITLTKPETYKTIYAVWKLKSGSTGSTTYTINYAPGSADVTNMPSLTDTYTGTETSHTFTVPSTIPVRSGYTFEGWGLSYNTSTVSYSPGASITLNSSNPTLSLWAVWQETGGGGTTTQYTYTVSFNKNTTSSVSNMPSGLSYGPTTSTSHQFTLPSNTPTRSGYTFLGWSESSTASIASYSGNQAYTVFQSNPQKTLYAVWEEDSSGGGGSTTTQYTYTISFNKNTTDSVSGMPSSLSYGPTASTTHQFTLPSSTPARNGYTFVGWANSSTSTTANYAPSTNITLTYSNSSKTIYAVWQENSTVGPAIIGSNDQYEHGSDSGITFTPTTPKTPDTVLLDGANIPSTDYAVNPTTGAVTVDPDYLDTLTDGSHTITIAWDDGTTSSTSFTTNGKTGEEGGQDNEGESDGKSDDESDSDSEETSGDETEGADGEDIAEGDIVAVPDTGSATENGSGGIGTALPFAAIVTIITLAIAKLTHRHHRVDFKK